MRVLTLILHLALVSSAVAQSRVESDIKAINRFLMKMNERINILEEKIKNLETLSKPTGPRILIPKNQQQFSRDANKRALLAIDIPHNWSEKIVVNFLKEIEFATAKQRSFGSNDYQSKLIQHIPMKYAETTLLYPTKKLKFYIHSALPKMVGDQDKVFVMKNLENVSSLVNAVRKRPEWHDEALPHLINALKRPNCYFMVFNFVTSKDTKEGNDAALASFEKQPSLIRLNDLEKTSLSYEKIKTSVYSMWDNVKNNDNYLKRNGSMPAIIYGITEALHYRVSHFQKNPNDKHTLKELNKVLKRSFKTDKDPLEWYEMNKAKITFNEETKKYFAKE